MAIGWPPVREPQDRHQVGIRCNNDGRCDTALSDALSGNGMVERPVKSRAATASRTSCLLPARDACRRLAQCPCYPRVLGTCSYTSCLYLAFTTRSLSSTGPVTSGWLVRQPTCISIDGRRAARIRAAPPDAFCESKFYAAILPSTCSTMCANSALRLSHCIANPSSVMPGYCIAVKMKRLPAPGRSTTRAGQ